MKRITCFTYLSLCVLLAFLFSCQDEHDSALPGNGYASVRVAFQTPDYVNVGTRATNETTLKEVTALQFKDGKLFKKIDLVDKLFIQAVDLDGLESMPAANLDKDGKLISGNENVIVFLANIPQCFPDFFNGLVADGTGVGGTTYAQFVAKTADLATPQALADLQFMPMTGFYYGGITQGITNQINVTLNRSLAKINFTLNTDNFQYLGNPVTVTVNTIELRNVPLKATIFPQNRPALPVGNLPGDWGVSQAPYPATSGLGNSTIGTDSDNFTTLEVAHNQAGSVKTNFMAYMPENARGSYPEITSNKTKFPATISDTNKQKGWTYIYVDLDFSTLDGIVKHATYKIYLGGDDKGDINLLAGVSYNVTTYLYGANIADTRITLSSIFDSTVISSGIYNVLPLANSYIINPGGNPSPANDVISLVQARNGWRQIQNTLTAADNPSGANYVQQFDDLIASDKWEVVTLWRTWTSVAAITTTTPSSGNIVTGSASTDKYFVRLNGLLAVPIGGDGIGHNCVLALKSTDVDGYGNPIGTIWWTWHLWFTDYNPDGAEDEYMKGQLHTYFGDAFRPGGLYSGKKMMDRNLGATMINVLSADVPAQPSATDAPKYYGMLYQWGRKDPFTASRDGGNTNAVIIYDVSGNPITGGTNNDGFPKVIALAGGVAGGSIVSRLIDAVRSPMNYYHSGSSNDWTRQDNSLWNMTTKTAFDPCPPGWRVPAGGATPAYNPWAGFNGKGPSDTANTTLTAADFQEFRWWNNSGVAGVAGDGVRAGRLYDATKAAPTFGSPLGSGDATKAWYPASGLRNNTSGAFGSTGAYGEWWSCAVTSTNAYYFVFNSAVVNPVRNLSRAYGFAVRCVQN